mgnify:CR=1 FL=1
MFTINGKGGTVTGGTSTSAKGGLLSAAARQGIVAKTEGALSYLNGKSFPLMWMQHSLRRIPITEPMRFTT